MANDRPIQLRHEWLFKDHVNIKKCPGLQIHNKINISFDFNSRKWTNEPDYVIVKKHNTTCSSVIGYKNFDDPMDPNTNGPFLYLDENCILDRDTGKASGTILHEFIHAWGFYHEHNRPDRNKYIKVYKESIKDSLSLYYEIKSGTLTFGLPYDYGSIMHYHPWGDTFEQYRIKSKVIIKPFF